MSEQLALVDTPAPRRRASATTDGSGTAEQLPVALVAVDTPLAHLDRPFEYTVPAADADRAVPGARVRVRFAGKEHGGFVLERRAIAQHDGRLAPIGRVVSPEPVLTPHLARVCRAVAEHEGGTLADVLRLAIPPRHARAEQRVSDAVTTDGESTPAASRPLGPTAIPAAWADHPAGAALLRRLAEGGAPGASWTALPGRAPDGDWPQALAEAVAATAASGRGSVVVLPDHRDVDRLEAALSRVIGPGRHERLSADLGPERRYAAWLRLLRGHSDIAIGTRSAAFAPVRRPGLLAWWDDGDDLHSDPHAPYPHTRTVLRLRAADADAALLSAGYGVTPQVQHWVQQGLLAPMAPASAALRANAPRVVVAGEGRQADRDGAADVARLPSVAFQVARDGLRHGPVLVQVPRRGYLPGLSCQDCRAPVRCRHCNGPVALTEESPGRPGPTAACRWCSHPVDQQGRECPRCGSTVWRSSVVGEARTAEEIGRAFPGVLVRTSRAGQVLGSVPDDPAMVVATPGAEPAVDGGYGAVLLLDAWALLDRAGLDTTIEAARRWYAAAALVRRGDDGGGRVVLVGAPPHASVRAVEALVRWDPRWLAAAELAERAELGLPPVVRHAVWQGEPALVELIEAQLADVGAGRSDIELLGPVPTADEGQVRLVVRAGRAEIDLPGLVHAMRARRSARKETGALTVRIDPADLGR